MRQIRQTLERRRRRRPSRAEAVLDAAGLQAVRVERCPDPNCPVCAPAGREAA